MPTNPPEPRLSLPPRDGGWRQKLWAGLGVLMFAAMLVAMVVFVGPALLSDWRIRAGAQPAEAGRIVHGSCDTRVVLAICDVTLTNRTPSGTVTRSVYYLFTDVHLGDYTAAAVADPARPDLVSTDLALERLWNRTLTFLVAGAIMALLVLMPAVAFVRNRRTRAA